ncbi:MAG: hypothetical protein GTN70_01165 [Deltaproteobacteria bacterium]|nr:hypothetical protein [Deltaproteobacteria bacterium]NIS76262.1 hypothetical protein [Deltaproteobacteria bacterium]
MVTGGRGKWSYSPQLLGKLLLVLISVSMLGCVAAVPVIIKMASSKHYTATVQMKTGPEDVYRAVIAELEKKPDVKIETRDDEKFLVEATKGEIFASIHAEPLKRGTQLIVTADAGGKDEDKDLALRIVKAVCDLVGEQCKAPEEG